MFLITNRCIQGHAIISPKLRKIFAVHFTNILFKQNRFKCDKPFGPDLSSSTILIQDGCNVQELPLIIRKVKDIWAPAASAGPDCGGASDSGVHRLIHREFLKCSTFNEVISLLSKCSSLTPNIALGAVERILVLKDSSTAREHATDENVECEILNKLIDIMKSSGDIYCIMNGIRIVQQRNETYGAALSEELLSRVTDNRLSVRQLCDAVDLFSQNKICPNSMENIEKLWIGFVNHEKDFSKEDLTNVFRVLPLLKASQRMVLGVLERKMLSLWWSLEPGEAVLILDILYSNRIISGKSLAVVARWTNTNIHTLPEDVLIEIVTKFTLMRYTDSQLEKALERYMKAKGVKISSHALVVSVLNHCVNFRLRNVHILNGCAEYFTARGRYLPPMYIKPILFPFGWLNFNPINKIKFWEEVEKNFSDKFSKMNVEDVLDVMLNCIYLQKYPLNFVEKVFNPHFLERLNTLPNCNVLRNKLKLIDTAMTLECKTYRGPLLPKDHHSKSLWQDGRIRRLVHQLQDRLAVAAGGPGCLSTFVILPHIFTTELYTVDVMLHPRGLRSSLLNLNLRMDRNISAAILIHVPEHYSADGQSLVGPQAMRKRHLRILGLKVISLNFETLSKLRMRGDELDQYLMENIKNAEPAIEPSWIVE